MRSQISEIRSLMGRIDESYSIDENSSFLVEQTKEECFNSTKKYHNGDKQVFDKLCMADPTTDLNGKDCAGKYMLPLLRWYSNGYIKNLKDLKTIANDIEDFNQVFSLPTSGNGKNSILRPTTFSNGENINFDVNNFSNPKDFHEYLNRLKSENYGTEGDTIRRGSEIVGDEYDEDGDVVRGIYDGWEIIKLNTKEASNIIGKYTQWCTSRTKLQYIPGAGEIDTNEFDDYNNQGDLYVIKKYRDKGKNRNKIFQVFIDKTGTMAEFRNGANIVVPLNRMEAVTSPKVCQKVASIAQKKKDEFEKSLIGFKEEVKKGNLDRLVYRKENTYSMYIPDYMLGFFNAYENEHYAVLNTGQETGIRMNGGNGPSIPPHDKFVCVYCKDTKSFLKVNGEIYFTGAEVTPFADKVLIGTTGWPGGVWHIVKVNGDEGTRITIAGNDTFNLYKTSRDNELLSNMPPHGESCLFKMDSLELIPFQGNETVNFEFENPGTYIYCPDDTKIIYNDEHITFGSLRKIWENEPNVEESRKRNKKRI